MKRIKQYIDNKREQNRLQNEANLKAEFKVTERGGYLWFTHNGVAFMKIEESDIADYITKMLNTSRETAVEFARL